MIHSNEKVVEILNELVQINNDRIDGYDKAAKETNEQDLKEVFNEMASKSHLLRSQLESEITKRGGQPTTSTTTSGKIFRVWMDFKAALTGKDRKAILSSCEFGEDAAQETYQNALNHSSHLPNEMIQLIAEQKAQLNLDHKRAKSLRDTAIHA